MPLHAHEQKRRLMQITSIHGVHVDELTDAHERRSPLADPSSEQIDRQRLRRLRCEMMRRDIGACVLLDPVNVRFATGSRNMQVFMMRNPARYVFIALDGPVVMFEYPGAWHIAEGAPLVDDVRTAVTLSHTASGSRLEEMAVRWAAEIADLSRQCGAARVGVDVLKPEGVVALERRGIVVVDAQDAVETAKSIKSFEEIAVMRESLHIVEAAVMRLRESLAPGMTEIELWATLHEQVIAHGGEYIETRLLSSGTRTNPWFHEASDKVIVPGDLVGLDTDVVGPGGFYTDFSRTFVCGPRAPSDEQRRLYELALTEIAHNMTLLRPGASFREVTEKSWKIPDDYVARRYFCLAHGVGLTGEYPYILHREDYDDFGYDGIIEENMTLCVESYIGKEGGRDGVKLEQQVVVARNGPELLTTFPWEEELL